MTLPKVIFALLVCVLISPVGFAEEKTSDADKDLLKAVQKLDRAFSNRDKETIRKMTDRRHISISPSYQFFNQKDQLKALPELKLSQFKTGEKKIIHTTPRSALITYEAQLEGTFEGKALTKHVQIVECWIKKKENWIEVSYQETPLP